ncbi:MAG: metallophosphoesterase [Bacillota bacterium]|nr:metallophosphoesterase [Bacillota bacterium]
MKIKKHSVYVLFILVIFLSLAGCSSSNTSAGSITPKIKTGKDITFFVTSDIHYLAKDLTDGGEAFQKFFNTGDGRELNYIAPLLSAFTRDIKDKKPDVLIVSGDLTNNGEKESHLELAKRLEEIKKSGTLVYVIPGNHDILNPYARGFRGSEQYVTDSINDNDFSNIYGDFGYNDAVLRDSASLSYLAAPSEDVWLLMLDTAKYESNMAAGTPEADGEIRSETFQWIKKCSALAKQHHARLIAVMHHSLMDHGAVTKDYTLNNSRQAIEAFQAADIELSLTGHIHLQDIKSHESGGKTIYDIASSCFGKYPQEYGVLKYSSTGGFDYTTSPMDVEGWARETHSTDENLINFTAYSKDFLAKTSYSRVYFSLAGAGYTDEQIDSMFKTYNVLNQAYYEGKPPANLEEIKNSEGYKLWTSADGATMQKRIISFANSTVDNTKLHIPLNQDK